MSDALMESDAPDLAYSGRDTNRALGFRRWNASAHASYYTPKLSLRTFRAARDHARDDLTPFLARLSSSQHDIGAVARTAELLYGFLTRRIWKLLLGRTRLGFWRGVSLRRCVQNQRSEQGAQQTRPLSVGHHDIAYDVDVTRLLHWAVCVRSGGQSDRSSLYTNLLKGPYDETIRREDNCRIRFSR